MVWQNQQPRSRRAKAAPRNEAAPWRRAFAVVNARPQLCLTRASRSTSPAASLPAAATACPPASRAASAVASCTSLMRGSKGCSSWALGDGSRKLRSVLAGSPAPAAVLSASKELLRRVEDGGRAGHGLLLEWRSGVSAGSSAAPPLLPAEVQGASALLAVGGASSRAHARCGSGASWAPVSTGEEMAVSRRGRGWLVSRWCRLRVSAWAWAPNSMADHQQHVCLFQPCYIHPKKGCMAGSEGEECRDV
jgi:hypothetical protein